MPGKALCLCLHYNFFGIYGDKEHDEHSQGRHNVIILDFRQIEKIFLVWRMLSIVKDVVDTSIIN